MKESAYYTNGGGYSRPQKGDYAAMNRIVFFVALGVAAVAAFFIFGEIATVVHQVADQFQGVQRS